MQPDTRINQIESIALRAELVDTGLIEPDAPWHPLTGGRTNQIWRVGSGNSALVCKVFEQENGTALFPNDGPVEARVLEYLSGTGLAPEFIAFRHTCAGPCLLYRHVPGAPLAGQPMRVAEMLATLHAIAPPAELRHIASGARALQSQALDILANCQSKDAGTLRAFIRNTPETPPPNGVFLHGDLVPGNIIENKGTLTLIDWQCPAIGDPCEDIATFLSPAMQILYGGRPLDAAEEGAFLLAYPHPETVARFQGLRPWFHLRMAAHCLWKTERGDAGYAQAFRQELAALEKLR